MRIVHISDVHFGFEHLRDKAEKAIKQINDLEPDIVVLTGDICLWGIHREFREAYETLSHLKQDIFAVPGNHDARNDGLKYFRLYFGNPRKSLKIGDVNIIGVDTTLPDTDDGYIGPEQREWVAKKVRGDCVNVIAMHHHVVPVPHTGRNMNVLIDAAETVEALTLYCNGGIVLAGHRHVPYSTKLLRTHIIHAGSLSSYKVLMPDNNYNVIEIDEGEGKINLKLRFIDLGEVEIGTFSIKPETPESLLNYYRLTSTRKVLFVSKKNSCRTKIAEALFNRISPESMQAVSAVTDRAEDLDDVALKVLEELGIPMTKPRGLRKDMMDDADYIVSFDEDIKADEYWDIKKPENVNECRKVVEDIENRIKNLPKKLLKLSTTPP